MTGPALCGICGRTVAVVFGGTLAPHRVDLRLSEFWPGATDPICPGSGRRVAEAEEIGRDGLLGLTEGMKGGKP